MARWKRAVMAIGLLLAATPAVTRDKASEAEEALMTSGRALAVLGKFGEALPIVDRVIAMVEKRTAGEKRRLYSGQTAEMLLANMLAAASAGTDAIDVGPAYGEALFWRGYALIELNRHDEAGAPLDRAVAVSPANPQFLCETGNWHNEQRDFAGAMALFERCDANSGYAGDDAAQWHAMSQRGRGYALIELGRFDEAERIYKARLAEEPRDAKARSELDYIDQQRKRIGRSTS